MTDRDRPTSRRPARAGAPPRPGRDLRARVKLDALEPTAYAGVLSKDPDSEYSMYFPDLPGCVTAGRTIEEALFSAREALALHLQGLMELRRRPPRPTNLYDLARDPQHGEGLAVMIEPWPADDDNEPETIELKLSARTIQALDNAGAVRHKTRAQIVELVLAEWFEHVNSDDEE
ncbi:MAG: type II toxin-antitoxin system HicB family antitoxin [Alphaproteobacteria bacterium]|nr:type II toxin-antitoxin system HicB family antitoxin [Alphaproteobacteria bacterium SS10]